MIETTKTKADNSSTTGKQLHFIGIGGISMSSLAMIALSGGSFVTGSDRAHSGLTDKMESAGIKIYYSHSAENLPKNCDAVIYTAAVHDDNPELAEARRRNIPCYTRAEFLGKLMLPYSIRIGIAGTHGKSTTTSMASMIALRANTDPTIVSGAELAELGGAYRIGHGNSIIFEACEYTDSFLSFYPTTAVVLNVELEHVDYFHSLKQITDSFHKYMSSADIAVVCADSEAAMKAADGISAKIVTYSTLSHKLPENSDVHYFTENIRSDGTETVFTLMRHGKDDTEKTICTAGLRVPGIHNISDAVAAAAACIENGIPAEAVRDGLHDFHGAKRRFEYRGKNIKGALIYDDYAHHPTEIKATLAAAKSLGHKIWCVFQPHTYSRTYGLFDELAVSFADADRVIITDIYSAGREINESGVTPQALADAIPDALYLPKGIRFEQPAEYISANAEKDDLVLIMGAGDITTLSSRLIEMN